MDEQKSNKHPIIIATITLLSISPRQDNSTVYLWYIKDAQCNRSEYIE